MKKINPKESSASMLEIYDALKRDEKSARQKFQHTLNLLNEFNEFSANIKKRVDAIPHLYTQVMELALKKSWFFGCYDGLDYVFMILEEINKCPENLDNIMQNYYRRHLECAERALINLYPHRTECLKSAFAAHRYPKKLGYYLSIPVFITQADGILEEITKENSPLSKCRISKEIKAAKKLRDKIGNNHQYSYLINQFLSIGELEFLISNEHLENISNEFNRHKILHGESYNYGNEINSLKAFSFLCFIGLHIPMWLEFKN